MNAAAASETNSRDRFRVLALIMAVQTVANLGALGLPALAPLLREDLALTRQAAGSFLSVFYVGGALTSLPAGWLADRLGVRATLVGGQSLVALHEAGVAPTEPAYQRGVQFLIDTQLEDGSWLVSSRALPFQPYFESGFPHGEDQWISAAATNWAAMALMPAAR